MAWLEVKINTKSYHVEKLTDLFEDNGVLAITTQDAKDQPIYEPLPDETPIWNEVIITGLFEENCDLKTLLEAIESQFPDLRPAIHHLADQDWERSWMQDFKPMQFGERLWIIPSYQPTQNQPYAVILDPGLAFGTGKHPTTALCLKWLDKNIHGGETVIDYGCGSGILAIAAIRLGAAKVYAVDHDPQALLATQENAARNKLSKKEIITLYPDDQLPACVDILIANILANPIIRLAEKFAGKLRSKGKIVLSGILEEQAQAVIDTYQQWFEVCSMERLENWVRIDGVKKI